MSNVFRIKIVQYMHQTFYTFDVSRVAKCLKRERWLFDKCPYLILKTCDTEKKCVIQVNKQKGEFFDVILLPHIQNIFDMKARKNRLGLCIQIWPPEGMCFGKMADEKVKDKCIKKKSR